jgi:hypothetical protein
MPKQNDRKNITSKIANAMLKCNEELTQKKLDANTTEYGGKCNLY